MRRQSLPSRQIHFSVKVRTTCRYNLAAGFQFGGMSRRNSQPPLEVAPPAVLPRPPQKRREGHHESGNLAVFLNNRGEVTAYTSSGHKLWQARLLSEMHLYGLMRLNLDRS